MPENTTLAELREQANVSEQKEEPQNNEVETQEENVEQVHTESPKEFDLVLENDEPASEEQQVPARVHIHKLQKIKAQKREKEDEIKELRDELEQLKTNRVNTPVLQQQNETYVPAPSLSQYDYDEDKYAEAMANYVASKTREETSRQLEEQRNKHSQQQQLASLSKKVEGHIERADDFISKNNASGLTADMYITAETAVRNSLDPNNSGIVDQIVAHMGNGSEKVMYYLGRNAGELLRVQQELQQDHSGISALMHLGSLKEKLNQKQSHKVSSAPPPENVLSGDVSSTVDTNLQKAYEKAAQSGDVQKMVSVKAEARRNGIKINT